MSNANAPANANNPDPLTRILNWIRQAGSPSEGKSDRNGFLSWAGENHAVAIGFCTGYVGDTTLQSQLIAYAMGRGMKDGAFSDDPHLKDVAEEPAYALAAMSVGKALRRADLAISHLSL